MSGPRITPEDHGVSGTFAALERTSPIVEVNAGVPTTTSMRVANGTQVQHKNVLELIRANLGDFEEFGLVAFETRPRPDGQHGGGDVQVAILNEEHATLLLTYMRNSAIVRDFKKRLVREFWKLRRGGEVLDLSDPIAAIEAANTRSQQAIEIAKAERARAELAEAEAKVLTAAIERTAPLVAKAEAHTGSHSDIHRQEFAREVQAWGAKQNLTIKQADVLRFLGHIGLFIRGERSDTGHATADAHRRGLAFTHKDTARNGYAYAVGKLTPAGQDYAWKRITKYVDEHGSLELPRELRGGEPA